MDIKFPSDEWIKEFSRQLNSNTAYEKSAKDWEGNFLFISEPDEVYPEKAYMYLALHHGKSPDAAMLAGPDEREAEFVITAPAATWRRVVEGKLDPIQALMTGKLKLQGDMMKVMRYPKAAKELVNTCSLVPTDFGD